VVSNADAGQYLRGGGPPASDHMSNHVSCFAPLASVVPVHLANVHAALLAAPFEAAAAAEDAAVARVRAMRAALVVGAFNGQAGEEPPVVAADLAAGAACRTMYTRLVGGAAGAAPVDREQVDCVEVPRGLTPLGALCLQLRHVLHNHALWAGAPAAAPGLLARACRDEKAFAAGWAAGPTEDGETLFREFAAPGGTVKIFLASPPVRHVPAAHDEEALGLTRAAATVSHTLAELGAAPRSARVAVEAPDGAVTLCVDTFLSVPDGKFVHDVASDVYAPGAPRRAAAGGTGVLAVVCTGIQHDAIFEYPRGVAKAAVALRLAAPMHPVFGLHDTAAVAAAMPQLLRAAHRVGEVHFMTQIAKAILRARPEKDSAAVALTVEQRGAHLRDEVKLCAYWDALRGALRGKERACLELAIARMREKRPISYEALGGAVASEASPAIAHGGLPAMPGKSLHHVEARVRIKGSLSVPCAMLGAGPKSLNVRIDNVWVLESHLLALK
jgi:hypothetical protein